MSLMFFPMKPKWPLPPREVRITEAAAHPSPDGYRVALSITLTPFLEYPTWKFAFTAPLAKKNAA